MKKGDNSRGVYRAIYTSIWDDTDFKKLSPETKLVLLNLRTSPLSNMPAIFPFYLEAIHRQTGLPEAVIKEALLALQKDRWIVIEEGIIWIRNGLKFDPTISLNNKKHLSAIKSFLQSLPKIKLVKDFCDYYKIEIPYQIAYKIPNNIPYAYQEPEPEPETDKKENPPTPLKSPKLDPQEIPPPGEEPKTERRPFQKNCTEEQRQKIERLALELQEFWRTATNWVRENILTAHPDAIILTLQEIDKHRPAYPKQYADTILERESQNFRERDAIQKHEKRKLDPIASIGEILRGSTK